MYEYKLNNIFITIIKIIVQIRNKNMYEAAKLKCHFLYFLVGFFSLIHVKRTALTLKVFHSSNFFLFPSRSRNSTTSLFFFALIYLSVILGLKQQ